MDPYNFEGYGQSGLDHLERRWRRRARVLVGAVALTAIAVVLRVIASLTPCPPNKFGGLFLVFA